MFICNDKKVVRMEKYSISGLGVGSHHYMFVVNYGSYKMTYKMTDAEIKWN